MKFLAILAYFILGCVLGHLLIAAFRDEPPPACQIVQAYTNAGYTPTDRQKQACALQRMKELREIDSE